MIGYRDIENWASCEISAWFVCESLGIDYSGSTMTGDLLLIPDHLLNTKFSVRGIIAQLHSTIKKEITETKLRTIKNEFRWRDEEPINSLELDDLISNEISQNALATVYAVRALLYELSNISDEEWFEEARESVNTRTLSWAQTGSFKYQLDQLDNVIYEYNQCPLKCNELERDVLRLFAYLYANTACFDFFSTLPAFAFSWDNDLTLSQLESGYFVIDKAKVLSMEKYNKVKDFPALALVGVLLYPSLIFLLFWWYFDFSRWNTPEFWLSLLASLLLGDLSERRKAKAQEIIAKNKKDLKKRTLRHFKKVNKLLIFATREGQMLIDDLLQKSLSGFNFESYSLSMPDSVRQLLKDKKHRGEQLV
ncbi:hypothetical protein N9X99_00645 [Gammaproteobacteria bacterium]|nr:hypothetical protein [Gammaproteobacteria bacterium]